MYKLLLPIICLAFTIVRGQKFGCFFDDNELISNATSTGTRSHDRNPVYSWGSGKADVRYYFSGHFPEHDRRVVRQQMRRISRNVPCIKFHEKASKPSVHHLMIQFRGNGQCSRGFSGQVRQSGSNVVMEFFRRLADSSACANYAYVQGGVLHELMHVLGIMHTQKRCDRDQHIYYHPQCVQSGRHSQYQKDCNLNNHGVPYTCNSVMHYGSQTFGNGKCPTMTPKSAACKRVGISAQGSNHPNKEDWLILRRAHCER